MSDFIKHYRCRRMVWNSTLGLHVWRDFEVEVNLEDIATELASRAKGSKRGIATALRGAVQVKMVS
jgi:hypothetical protein